ncbi:hypothetical protein GCM10020331_050950 [Ectobacillus funiculus]
MFKLLRTLFLYLGFTLLINVGFWFGPRHSYYLFRPKKESVGLVFFEQFGCCQGSLRQLYMHCFGYGFFDPSAYGVLNSLRALVHMSPVDWLTTHPMTAIILANGVIGASYGMIIFFICY